MLGFGDYFWRLIPANPILLRVVALGSKRVRDAIIRAAYLGALIVVVGILLLQSGSDWASASLAALSRTSQDIFKYMSYAQLALVALLAPIFTAGAITQEKDSQTYDILLSTPLTNGQIVLGSLLSRLFFVVSLLLSGIPIFAITQIFGGVAIKSIVLSMLIASATAFITGAIAMAIAVLKVGTRRTIFSFYLVIMLYLAIPMALEQMQYAWFPTAWDTTGKVTSHVSWLAGLHPFLALRVIFGDVAYRPPEFGTVQTYGWPWNWYLSSPHTFYIALMFFFSFVLIMPSTLFLRRLAQSSQTIRGWILTTLRLSKGDKTRRPRRVWTNPIAWREAKTKASANRAILLRYGFMLAGIGAAATLVYLSSRYPAASKYIAFGYNAEDRTFTIMEDEQPTVYRLAAPGYGNQGAIIRVPKPNSPGEFDQIGASGLRAGMLVTSYTLDTRQEKRTISSLDLQYPQPILSDKTARQLLLAAVMVELAVILLILTQSAASTVTREKEDGTLDLLLSTPITSRYYIWGKLRGLVSFVLPLVAVPVASIVLFIARDLFRSTPWTLSPPDWIVFPEAILLLPATLVMVTAFASILGMHMSLRCRKTVMAVMASVGIVAGVCGAFWLCGSAVTGSVKGLGPLMGSFSPFTLMGLLIDPLRTAGENFGVGPDGLESRIWVFFGGWGANAVYAMVIYAMYKSMVHNFDMTIRKQAA